MNQLLGILRQMIKGNVTSAIESRLCSSDRMLLVRPTWGNDGSQYLIYCGPFVPTLLIQQATCQFVSRFLWTRSVS